MKITFLGTGSPGGMPVMTCSCRWCLESKERLRPGLLIQHEGENIILDAGPDIRKQIIQSRIKKITAVFLTHYHFDHFWGVAELEQLNWVDLGGFTVYLNEDTYNNLKKMSWIKLKSEILKLNRPLDICGMEVEAVDIKHSENLKMSGYIIRNKGKKIVYIPDIKSISDDDLERCKEADILVIDGQYILGKYIDDDDHLGGKHLIKKIKEFNAKKVYLIAFSEHWYKISAKGAEKHLPDNFNIPDDQTTIEL
ncbi:MAG: MBL fold metallo-hydrolase [Candidatus Aenigmarchaeota archaeon]|nr:MBL fold metallo-hydrolase [Candidatus Aenigmarchaeota archaeon]